MEKKPTVFEFLGQILFVFGITVVCLMVFCLMFGDDGKELSTIFSMGAEGLAVNTLVQFLLMSALITMFRWLFFTDMILKKWSIMVRTIGMFIAVVVIIGVFATVFGWFPTNEIKSWIMFLVCFFICMAVSVSLSVYREKTENEKMQRMLERMKKGEL